jgi:peptidoglycan hydrolase FlgJ
MKTAPAGGAAALPPRDERAELRRAAHALEGVFTAQLLQAMRASVPESGLLEEDPGREMFQSLLDEHLASATAGRMKNGIGELLYRQLVRHLDTGKDEPSR